LISPKRLTASSPQQGIVGVKSSFYPKLDLFGSTGHFQQSLVEDKRVSVKQLRSFARSIPARKAIRRIGNGVLAMPWVLKGVDENKLGDIHLFTKALQNPNREEHNTYLRLCRALVSEIITLGFAAVERQRGDSESQPFWLWVANGENLSLNPLWNPGAEEEPRYYQRSYTTVNSIEKPNSSVTRQKETLVPIFNENLFLITYDSNAHEIIPPGPLEIAYEMISAWLGLGKFQHLTTSNAVREYLLILEGVTQDELTAFRSYWRSEVLGQGDIPIIGGSGIDGKFSGSVLKLGARNDEELYPKYTEYQLKIIALAFDLCGRDYNLTDHDNRATSGAAADATFADAVLPMALTLKDAFSSEVIKYYSDNYYFDYIDTEPRTQSDEANTSNVLYTGNILNRNEARLRLGEKPIKGGNAFADGFIEGDNPKKPTNEPAKNNQNGVATNLEKEVVSGENTALKKVKKPKGVPSQNIQLSLF